jgi:hypothetical protein
MLTGAWLSLVLHAASTYLKVALVLTMAGTLLLLLTAIVLPWTTPERAANDKFTCFMAGANKVKIVGTVPEIRDGTLQIVPC